MKYLFDTNLVSELYKYRNGKINLNVENWLQGIIPSETAISCITLSEIKTGILLKARKDTKQAYHLAQWLKNEVLPAFENRVLIVDSEVALLAAEYHISNKMDLNDAYIAATAKVNHLTLVTRNVKDFAGCGIKLISPFDTE
ncbi:PilT protein-like protein [Mannheimia sp. USDA-ARS-USMARC-1261]|uniref:type II toxin-antitoxin system VapC family toxin n=1 Tax=Mannheimia sp. USDA-ARS-USMARC-1261 TaxID=1432056 RepID=UPI0003E34A56|nr:type II toxin-antitoxin system VapC family toxin [Mannheimia sp. USDA-ARS-USMARC-1261]AHG74495.1 PilT protein-like protein [Mannheimia sp. USDA-ARS-USMARC-1261]